MDMQRRRYTGSQMKETGGSVASFAMESLAGADSMRVLNAAGLRDGN